MAKGLRAGCVAALAALVLAAACAQVPAQPASAAAAKSRVVIQVSDNDPARWNLALNNARNLQSALGASNVEIEIVAYGPGIGMLQAGSAVGTRIDEATLGGMHVSACENTMHGRKLTRADMLPGIGYVGSGVVEITRRQQEGWSYLRP
jgi:uncharacterized protein